ncbi:helicase POLQ-like [Tribolium madens]|uniref:helicase POLQ-like n=1 Tax=Tribolium madens TaxID=41895 RepID=UPI001CF747E8|nr:helicase POLQ-like [Tribolium madens]
MDSLRQPVKRTYPVPTNSNFKEFVVPQPSVPRRQLTQNKSQKFSVLSLSKNKKGVDDEESTENRIGCKMGRTNKRLSDETNKDTDKKCKLEEYSLEDTLFDDINLTQLLMNHDNSCNKSKVLSTRSCSDNSLHNKDVNAFQQNMNDATQKTTIKSSRSKSDQSLQPKSSHNNPSETPNRPLLTQLTQLFDSTQVMNQIETILSKESNSGAKSNAVLREKNTWGAKISENLGDVLNENNREEFESFFDQIEHSVSVMGTNVESVDKDVSKILEALFGTQTVEGSDKMNVFGVNENEITMSGINASFATALKQVLLSNVTKEIVPVEKPKNVTLVEESATFTEVGPFYGLPLRVKELIKNYKGIEELYDWQDKCLKLPAIKEHRNLIYALPTSGGKTLVAEILMLQEIMCRKKNALFILPYVAIVQEKVWALSPFAVALDFLVEEYAASKGTYPPRKRRRKRSIYIATIEKALGLLNSLIETERINEIGLIVVDELHLVGESGRGSTLEALLTKIMYINANIQVVGMSATIGNVNDLCKFLNADIYTQNFRPIELVEYVKCGPEVAKINYSPKEEELLTVVRKIDHSYPDGMNSIDPDKLGALVMEVIPEGSCLIFCASKKNCENVAYLLCKVVNKSLLDYKKEEKEQVKHSLKDEGGSLCKIFNVSIQLGIAYHHSGLTNEERRVIEEAFRAGVISVICCTSTLAAGVNLPAKRVILRQPYIGREFISLSKYKQMVGRAGRAGLGETGESILICNPHELPKVKKLLVSPMDEALSGMHENEGKGLRHLLLSCISLGVANTRAQLQEVSKKTLLNIQSERLEVNLKKITDKAISDLFKLGALQEADLSKKENNLDCDVTVRMETSFSSTDCNSNFSSGRKRKIVLKNDTKLVISKLGCAAIKGNFELTRAHQLYDDLHQAQKSLVLLDCLHLLYLVTPYDLAEQIKPNNNDYYNIFCKLGRNELQTARILGINDAVVMRMLSNQPIKSVPERVLNRFYLTLMLYDLWNEIPIFEVSEKFQVNRGIVQHLMTGAATFASNVVHFCEGLEEFWTFAHLLNGMSQRLSHCCVKELLPLMQLPAVKQSRARQLYNAGFKSIRSIAAANADNLVESIEYLPRRVAKQLIAAAKMLMLEKVENLREEAEDVLDGIENPKPFINQSILL